MRLERKGLHLSAFSILRQKEGVTSEPERGPCAKTAWAIFINHTIKSYGLTQGTVLCLVLPQLNGCISTSACFILSLYEKSSSKRMFVRETLGKSVVGWLSSPFVRVYKILKPTTCPVGPEMKASIFRLQIYTVLPSSGMENSRNGIIQGW